MDGSKQITVPHPAARDELQAAAEMEAAEELDAAAELAELEASGEPDEGGRVPRAQASEGPGRSPGSMRIPSPGEGSPPSEAERNFEPGELAELDGPDSEALEALEGAIPVKAPKPDGLPGVRHTGEYITGHLRLHQQVPSRFLDQKRDVFVYLPPGYDRAGNTERYPVLYMNDGNNLFDAEAAFGGNDWRVDETAEWMIGTGELRPMIIVGVANTMDRMDEYTWVPGEAGGNTCGGAGALYARFLIEELKRMVDREYRTLSGREHTGIAGSSLGGLISLYIAMHFSDVFSRVAIISPSLHWSHQASLYTARRMPSDLHIWLDMGWREDGHGRPPKVIRETRALRQILDGKGYEVGKNLAYFEDPRGTHSEGDWARRMPKILTFLFGPATQPAAN